MHQALDERPDGATSRPWASLMPNFGPWRGGAMFPSPMSLVVKLLQAVSCAPISFISNPGLNLWNNVKSTSTLKQCPMYGVGQKFNE